MLKKAHYATMSQIKKDVIAALGEAYADRSGEIKEHVETVQWSEMREMVLSEKIRIDGRGPSDVRAIDIETSILPRTHGSGLFQRGETQVLDVCTLAMPRMNQLVDTLNPETTKRFLHHYNMPPWANGETGRVGSPKRREIGHGALAARAILPVVPNQEEFAYTLRLVSEVLSSNGSTSMGSVCASSLSLMDAGVPIKAPVAGIAMGLIYDDGKRGSYEIQVTERSQAAVEQELEALLTGESGVRFRRIGGRFFLEGSVGTEAELKRIQQMAALYPDQVQSLVTVGGGTAADRSMLVRIDFFFVQYDKSSSYGVGLAWPASIGGNAVLRNNITYDFVAGTTTTAQASVVDQPLPRLDIASNHGWAKILRQASMLTSNGMEANFNSGGEQNFSVNTGLTIGLERISFGTVVTVLPRYDAKTQQVDLKLVSDISDLTAPASSTLPGRTYSRLTTNVRLKLGQALVLSGLHSRTQAHSVDGIPGLSAIPLLGLFFGSHSDRESATENAMFVIPSVVESVSNSSLAMIEGALKQYDDYDGDIEQAHPFTNKPPSAR
jgi:pilus assembly protein CpaC